MSKRLAKAVRIESGRPGHPTYRSSLVKLNKTRAQLEKEKATRATLLSTLDYNTRAELLSSGVAESDDYNAFMTLPPGEEGEGHSHAGHDFLMDEIITEMGKQKIGDYRTRNDRVQRQVDAWQGQLSTLVDAYLVWKHGASLQPVTPSATSAWPLNTLTMTECRLIHFIHVPGVKYINETLVRYGYLGASPDQPSLAFAFSVFDIYRQLHRVCPRLGIESFTRALNNVHHNIPQPHLAEQFRCAYDCYLEITSAVDKRVEHALERSPLTYLKTATCPPCMYKVKDEPLLMYSMMAAMDGNNSLKLVDESIRAGQPRADNRQSLSPRWISTVDVDKFIDDGVTKASRPAGENDTDEDWLKAVTESDEPRSDLPVCIERWKNAGPDARKKMFALFSVSGIFLAVCRHGHILSICDMIRSGELMKYPLAITDHLIDTYGPRIALGYDIMCAFNVTLARSSIGVKARDAGLVGVVPSFHGYAHNRGCQLGWHPLYTDGVGLEDFEECERTFSKSNELATVTRFATPYHRHQEINEFIFHHDIDKHVNSADFIYQNYRQALETITSSTVELRLLETRLKTTSSDYEKYICEEREYLKSLKKERPEVNMAAEYLVLLKKLEKAMDDTKNAKAEYEKNLHCIHGNSHEKSPEVSRIITRYRTTSDRFQVISDSILQYEDMHLIEVRWTPDSSKYKEASKLLSEQKYLKAVDGLERLVIQRSQETAKLGMARVGYALRTKIGEGLKNRAGAVCTALQAYNTTASQLNPPREPLTWASVMRMADLAEFDLLKDTRQRTNDKPWAKHDVREAIRLHLKIKRAREEIDRLNVEIKRLITFMRDEYENYQIAMKSGDDTVDLLLRSELVERSQYCDKISQQLVKRLIQLSKLSGFSGTLQVGQHTTRSIRGETLIQPPWLSSNGTLQEIDSSIGDFLVDRDVVDSSLCDQLIESLIEY
ncbi:hypothetical protein F5887DRAFT_1247567 [Amanita rubescens]|nr:hypothetical protein F5887DRAFT_1247567 [Amanita rubescens]